VDVSPTATQFVLASHITLFSDTPAPGGFGTLGVYIQARPFQSSAKDPLEFTWPTATQLLSVVQEMPSRIVRWPWSGSGAIDVHCLPFQISAIGLMATL